MAGFKAVDCGLPSAKAIAQQCNERARRQARPNWKAPFWGHTPNRFENENTAVRRLADF
jgi:hypothetical protein